MEKRINQYWTIMGFILFGFSISNSIPILTGSVSQEHGLYTYNYELSGVEVDRKVTGVAWVVIEGTGAPQPEYLPLSHSVPYFWSFQPGHDGPLPGGVWMSNTGENDGSSSFPIDPTWGTALSGQTRYFSFTTGYAPREGTYFLVENQNGSEVNYNFISGSVLVPNYDGSLIESRFNGNMNRNYPPTYGTVPEPKSFILFLISIGMILLINWKSRMKKYIRIKAN